MEVFLWKISGLTPGPLITDHRPLTTDHGPRTTDHGPQIPDHRPQTTDHRPLTKDHRRKIRDGGPQRRSKDRETDGSRLKYEIKPAQLECDPSFCFCRLWSVVDGLFYVRLHPFKIVVGFPG